MVKNVWQCCYTNASKQRPGGTISSGWQKVCVSPDAPRSALAACEKMQGNNSAIQGKMVDEDGKILNLLEISGDGSFLYIMRTQYGLFDRLKRANMFSHAYIFPCEDVISDPNLFLTISNDNFKSSEEEAEEYSDSLSKLPAFDITSAMTQCGLDQEKYLRLIKSVYARFLNQNRSLPLYVQYNGTEEHLRALLFCIYYALPLCCRRLLSVASVQTDNTLRKYIIFSKKAHEQKLYVDPATGESTILTDRVKMRLSRLGFLDYVVNKIVSKETDKLQDYFKDLEDKTKQLGDITRSDERIMSIAHILRRKDSKDVNDVNRISDSELIMRLQDALSSNSLGNIEMDKYIAKLLEELLAEVTEVTTKKLKLDEETERALNERYVNSKQEELLKQVKEYNFYCFTELETAEAAAKLSKMPQADFDNYSAKLVSSAKGKNILEHYFSEIMLGQIGHSWNGIQKVVDGLLRLGAKSDAYDNIDRCADELYIKSIAKLGIGDVEAAISGYENYIQIAGQTLDDTGLLECKEWALKKFWENVSYSNINFAAYGLYSRMQIKSKECETLLAFCNLPYILQDKGESEFFATVNKFFIEFRDDIRDQSDALISKIIEEIKKHSYKLHDDFDSWCKLLFKAEGNNIFTSLMTLYDGTRNNERPIQEIIDDFCRFIASYRTAKKLNAFIKDSLEKIILSICNRRDSEREPICLDDWLILGRHLCENSFDIFDKTGIDPFILSCDRNDVVKESKRIQEPKYRQDAECYIDERGSEYRTVKRWLSVIRSAERAERNRQTIKKIVDSCRAVLHLNSQGKHDARSNRNSKHSKY